MTTKWNNVKTGTKTWVHSAAALTAGHVVYNVKYLGAVEVSSPKGADIVKEAVTKLKFNKQVKRSEGTKPPKMELTVSVDGVTIQDRQTKEKQFTYPLHHISYCADDKSDKKICAFIAKDVKENKNMCHVMESDKNAEEITLTVGQAFDLAYQKFLSNANKTQEQQQQNDSLWKRVSPGPSYSPRMGRMYSHGTFGTGSPPNRGAMPPGTIPLPRKGKPPQTGTFPRSRGARAPQATSIASVRPLQQSPPQPNAHLSLVTPIIHPAPPTPPPPPPRRTPSTSSTNSASSLTPNNTSDPTPDTTPVPSTNAMPDPSPTTTPPDQPKEHSPEHVKPQDNPDKLYRPHEILQTKL